MSDLSLPLMPPDPQPGADAAERFAWPEPSLLRLASAAAAAAEPALACEVEGLNGHTSTGRLQLFDPERGLLHLLLPTSRSAVVLRFDQFRRLRLTDPLPL